MIDIRFDDEVTRADIENMTYYEEYYDTLYDYYIPPIEIPPHEEPPHEEPPYISKLHPYKKHESHKRPIYWHRIRSRPG